MKKTASLDPLVDVYQSGLPIDLAGHFSRNNPLHVEIGFGMGEVLVREAQNSKDKNFIGIEYHWGRIGRTLKLITRQKTPIDNIRILRLDARAAFEFIFTENSVDHIYSLFPCPWPKKEHIKHRLFSEDFLKLLNSRLKDRGTVHIVTDFHPYHEWIIEEAKAAGFTVQAKVAATEFNTKFERKWKGEGQEHFYEICLQKDRPVVIPKWKAEEMKTYRIKKFDAERFDFSGEKGGISVVFKDQLFDEKQKMMVVHLVVAEGHLTQHVRIGIMHDGKEWNVNVLSGQHYFPTKGIARAIELTYEAALRTTSL